MVFYLVEFSADGLMLMLSDRHNITTAKAKSLIVSLLGFALVQVVSFGTRLYIHMGPTFFLVCFPFFCCQQIVDSHKHMIIFE